MINRFLLLYIIASCVLGCASNKKNLVAIDYFEIDPRIVKIELKGDYVSVGRFLNENFKLFIDEFYMSEAGLRIQSNFYRVNSNFHLRKFLLRELNGAYYKNQLGIINADVERSMVFKLDYFPNRISPSYIYNGKPAIMFGNFALIIMPATIKTTEIHVVPFDLRIISGFDCTLKEGIICGDVATSITSAPFEENLILHYIQFLLVQKGGFRNNLSPMN